MMSDQKLAAYGSAIGGVVALDGVHGLSLVLPVRSGLTDVDSRLGYAVLADACAVLLLVGLVVAISTARISSAAIDPLLEGRALAIDGRVVDNTIQQLLSIVSTAAFSARACTGEMRLIPAAAIVFVVARLAFWIGYRANPRYRAFGMGARICLNLSLLLVALR
jgi:hypothetical protein